MKRNKLDRFETKSASEPSPEQIQQAKQTFVNLLTPIVEKMLKSPETIRPVNDSWESLARQAKFGARIPNLHTQIISGGAEKAIQFPKKFTDIDIEAPKKFTDIELELLRKIENGEH
jgi:hypothetical protein